MEHHKDGVDEKMLTYYLHFLCEPAAISFQLLETKKTRFILIAFTAFQTGLIVAKVGMKGWHFCSQKIFNPRAWKAKCSRTLASVSMMRFLTSYTDIFSRYKSCRIPLFIPCTLWPRCPWKAFATPRFLHVFLQYLQKSAGLKCKLLVIGPLQSPDNCLHFGQATIPGWSKFNSIVRSVKTPLLRSRTWQIKEQIHTNPTTKSGRARTVS